MRVSFDSRTLTHFGGLVLLQRFVQQLGLRERIRRKVTLRQRNQRYSVAETFLAVLYPLVLGLGRIETTRLLRRNGVFQYLTGLPAYPDPQTLRRFVSRMAEQSLPGLIALHDELRTLLVNQPLPLHSAVFDLDSTVLTVYGRQGGAAVGFNPRKHGRPSYMPLLCVEGQTRDCWEASYHPGNTSVATVVQPLLERAFAKLAVPGHRVRIRADGAFYDHKLMEWLEARRASYAIVARLTRPLQARLSAVRFHRARADLAVADFSYQPHGWSKPGRFIAVRRPVPQEPSWQLSLFRLGKHVYHVIVTNLDLQPLNVWQFYNNRAQIELVIRELKEAYALGKIPSRRWEVNEAFFQLVVFAYNLLNWFRRLCVPPALQRWTLATLRNEMLLVPGELVRPQRRPTLKLPTSFPHQREFWDIWKRIGHLRVE